MQSELPGPNTCQCCGHVDHTRTIKLITPQGKAVWLRAICAASALNTEVMIVRAAQRSAEDSARTDAQLAELRAKDRIWQDFLDSAAGPGERYDQIRALGGMARARAAFRDRK